MEKNNNFFKKLLKSLKEFARQLLVKLKKNPHFIPLIMLVISFVVYSLNLTHVSNTTATIQGKGMGICEFLTMLLSILSMIAMLNAFPKRKKPNYPIVGLLILLSIIIFVADYIYVNKIYTYLIENPEPNPNYYLDYIASYNMLYTHMGLVAATAVTVILEPLIAKLLKKINTNIEIEETNVANIELAEEE